MKVLWQSMYQTSLDSWPQESGWHDCSRCFYRKRGVEYLDKVHPIQRLAHFGVKLRSWTSTVKLKRRMTTAHTFLAVSCLRSVAGKTDGGNRLGEWNSNFGKGELSETWRVFPKSPMICEVGWDCSSLPCIVLGDVCAWMQEVNIHLAQMITVDKPGRP